MGSGRKYKICIILFLFITFFVSCASNKIKKETGELKNNEVRREFLKIMPKLEKCYEKTIIDKNGFYGKGILFLEIGKNGRTTNYKWKPTPPDNFIICTDSIVKNITFRELPDTVKIELPVSFIISVEDKDEIK